MLCDSNILIYAADPDDRHCAPFLERDDAAIASVSRIEVLGFTGFGNLSEDSRARLYEIVVSMVELAANHFMPRLTLREGFELAMPQSGSSKR